MRRLSEAEVDCQARNAPAANQGIAEQAVAMGPLTPDLHKEILITAGDEYLASLPASVVP